MQIQSIQNKIFEIRGQKVMLDFDLAELYDVETRALNQAVKRNKGRFPERFMFKLTKDEWMFLMSQNVTSKVEKRKGTLIFFLKILCSNYQNRNGRRSLPEKIIQIFLKNSYLAKQWLKS